MLNYNKEQLFKVSLFLIIIFFSFYRSPYIFINGRFFAEEGLHFAYVWKNGFFNGLFFVEEIAGYLNLIANIFASLASLVEIENAPFVNIYGSFLVVLTLPYLILFRDSEIFTNNNKKIIGAILLFCSPPFVPEIWLNTVNLQVYLCLISIIILFMKNLDINQKFLNHFIVFISGFSGIYTCSLLPLFAFNYFLKKNYYNLLNFLILSFATLFQLYLILYSKIEDNLHSSVLTGNINFQGFDLFIYNNVFKPFFGRQFVHLFWESLVNFFSLLNHVYVILFIFLFLLSLLLMNIKKIINFLYKDKTTLYLVYIFFTVSIIIIFGSLGNYFGGRYAVIPGVTLILILFYLQSKIETRYLKFILIMLITSSIITGIYEFRPPTKNVKHLYIKYLDCYNCPSWKEELIIWKSDENYSLKIWPYPQKTMRLN